MTPLLHLRHLLDFIATRYFSHRDGRRRLDAFLVQEGHAALPHYNYILERLSGLPLTRHSALVQILAGIMTARISCRLHYRDNTHYPALIPTWITFSRYAYLDPESEEDLMGMEPHPDAALLPGVPLASLDHAFSPFGDATGYDPASGHVHVRHGFNAYIKCSGNNIHVAFRGTDTGHLRVFVPNVLTDIFQLYSCDICYIRAAGLIRHLLNHVPGIVSLQATGHSLGGGMAQFGVAANAESFPSVRGVAVNAAGLSGNSLQALGAVDLRAAAGVLDHITTYSDPVSTHGGGLVGGRYRIPRQNAPLSNGHGIADVAACYMAATGGGGNIPADPR
ncbi:hypothetical protein [uncultured Akkermansia sp.]|jgi:hypothetical protein|uniref:hypothetical protein n=1 Tax=uncultured Akkermansia sp. TaxID=512294 RepID=UPI0025E7D0FC|nr:hypothetical protein [uncultured Akkermansia sp.]